MDAAFNLLRDPLIRVTHVSGSKEGLTLPQLLERLSLGDEVASIDAVRQHQRHAVHSFLCQLAAMVAVRYGDDWRAVAQGQRSEQAWTERLLGIGEGREAVWCLVSPFDQPAFMQPPLPDGEAAVRKPVLTPDDIDVLVTSKNFDVKATRMHLAMPDDWIVALVTLQTMEGQMGAGQYGASRMNGGFSSRLAFSVAPVGGLGAHFRRDVRRLVELYGEANRGIYASRDGITLTSLVPRDGVRQLRQAELDPYYVDCARRIRLVAPDGIISALTGSSKGSRVVGIPGGLTGDPWAPTIIDKDGATKTLSLTETGFDYRRVVSLLFGTGPSPLQALSSTEDGASFEMVARALSRGQGKTLGYHERRVPLSRVLSRGIRGKVALDPVAELANARVTIAGEMARAILKPALFGLFQNGADKIDYKNKGSSRRAEAYVGRFDAVVDREFFPALWAEAEAPPEAAPEVRRAWVHHLANICRNLVQEADAGASKASQRRFKARHVADRILEGSLRTNPRISSYFLETSRDRA